MMVEGHEQYEVEAILRHKGKGARRLYHVLWKGFPITEASWEPEWHLANAPQVMEEYLRYAATEDKPRRRQIRRRPRNQLMVFLRIVGAVLSFIGMGTAFVGV